jgi:hypothetical protein
MKKKKLKRQGSEINKFTIMINTLEHVSEADGGGTCNFGYCYKCESFHSIGKECSRGKQLNEL